MARLQADMVIVCWISIPFIVYLAVVPIWSRAAIVAKALYFAIADVLITIFWLSAFASVLSWNNSGILQGTIDKKIPKNEASCKNFAYGSEKKCKLSYSASSLGVVILYVQMYKLRHPHSGGRVKSTSWGGETVCRQRMRLLILAKQPCYLVAS